MISTKSSFFRSISPIIFLSAALSFGRPVFGQDTSDMLSKALALVHHVQTPSGNSPDAAQQIDLLAQAITMAQKAPNHRLQGHRVLAIQAIKSAITEIRSGDVDKMEASYLHTADTELSTSISLAGTSRTMDVTPSTTNSPAATPPVSGVPPPGVTPEIEQAFLLKYKAASEKQDPDLFFALFAMSPELSPKAKEDFKGMMTLGFLLDSSNLNRTYSFVPVPPGQPDKPTQLDGKMYGDYLPAVIELKIIFGKPDRVSSNEPMATGPTTLPLCIQDDHLMIIGLKEIPGAVPPPAVDKLANFGIESNSRKVSDKTSIKDRNAFASLPEFIGSLKQPSVEILASGESKYEYFAICRIAPNLCVWAGGDKVGQSNYGFYSKAIDSNQQELKGSQKWIRLVDVPTDNGQAPNVQGTVFFVPDHYSGSVTVETQYSDEKGNNSLSVSRTVSWK